MPAVGTKKGEDETLVKKKLIVISIIILGLIVVANLLDKKQSDEKVEEEMSIQIDLSAINSEKYFNQFKIKAALEKYAGEHAINCKTATALDYKYEDLKTAEQIYDIYFLLDDKEKTLITVWYHPQLDGIGLEVKAKACEYSLSDIKAKAWYKEDYQ